MAPKPSRGGKGFRSSSSGGGGGGSDDNGISAGEAVAIVVGIIGGLLLIWFIWAMIMDGLQKIRERVKRRATQMQEDGHQRYGIEQLHCGSLPKTYPTTPAYDTESPS